MNIQTQTTVRPIVAWWVFRIALFAAAASLAAYILYKYATQLHALEGFYAFLFPLSGVLALAGIIVAIRPRSACDCGVGIRAGVGALALLWMGTGLLCVPSLMEYIARSPLGGLFAFFHMTVQHVFLSLSLLAFAFFPKEVLAKFGVMEAPSELTSDPAMDQVADSVAKKTPV